LMSTECRTKPLRGGVGLGYPVAGNNPWLVHTP
jgi:hypothetical protein